VRAPARGRRPWPMARRSAGPGWSTRSNRRCASTSGPKVSARPAGPAGPPVRPVADPAPRSLGRQRSHGERPDPARTAQRAEHAAGRVWWRGRGSCGSRGGPRRGGCASRRRRRRRRSGCAGGAGSEGFSGGRRGGSGEARARAAAGGRGRGRGGRPARGGCSGWGPGRRRRHLTLNKCLSTAELCFVCPSSFFSLLPSPFFSLLPILPFL